MEFDNKVLVSWDGILKLVEGKNLPSSKSFSTSTDYKMAELSTSISQLNMSNFVVEGSYVSPSHNYSFINNLENDFNSPYLG